MLVHLFPNHAGHYFRQKSLNFEHPWTLRPSLCHDSGVNIRCAIHEGVHTKLVREYAPRQHKPSHIYRRGSMEFRGGTCRTIKRQLYAHNTWSRRGVGKWQVSRDSCYVFVFIQDQVLPPILGCWKKLGVRVTSFLEGVQKWTFRIFSPAPVFHPGTNAWGLQMYSASTSSSDLYHLNVRKSLQTWTMSKDLRPNG